MQISLPSDFALALQIEYDALKNANDSKHYANLVNIINLSHAVPFISRDLTASIEFYSSVGTDPFTPAVYTLDLGLAYLILPNVQLDAGANFGLTKASPDLILIRALPRVFERNDVRRPEDESCTNAKRSSFCAEKTRGQSLILTGCLVGAKSANRTGRILPSHLARSVNQTKRFHVKHFCPVGG